MKCLAGSKCLVTFLIAATVALCLGIISIATAADENSAAMLTGGTKCASQGPIPGDALARPHWNGWGVDNTQQRFQPAEMARLAASDVPKLKLRWAFGIPGVVRAFAQPTIVGDHAFFGTQAGKVYAVDTASGCLYWSFDIGRIPVRSAIVLGRNAENWTAYFGDAHGTVYALDAVTGALRWKSRVEDHPAAMITGGPALVGNTVFVPVSSFEEATGSNPKYPCCSFRGSVVAIEASSGKLLWKTYTIAEPAKPTRKNAVGVQLLGPSGASVWSSPTYDAMRHLVYIGTGDNYSDPPTENSDAIVALNGDTGATVWSRQMTSGDAYNIACNGPKPINCPNAKGPDVDFGSSMILVELGGGRRALIGSQKSGVVTAVDPDHNGKTIWQRRIGRGGALGGVLWGSAADHNNVYVALSDVVLHVVKDGTPGAQRSSRGVSFLLDDKIGGGLFALKLETGELVWKTPNPGCNNVPGCSPAQSAAVTAIPGIVFSGGLDGHLRAYTTSDGHVVWDADTKGEHPTINGVTGHGGSIDGPGPVVVDGVVYVNSGYGIFGGIPGNVLLAYSVDGH